MNGEARDVASPWGDRDVETHPQAVMVLTEKNLVMTELVMTRSLDLDEEFI